MGYSILFMVRERKLSIFSFKLDEEKDSRITKLGKRIYSLFAEQLNSEHTLHKPFRTRAHLGRIIGTGILGAGLLVAGICQVPKIAIKTGNYLGRIIAKQVLENPNQRYGLVPNSESVIDQDVRDFFYFQNKGENPSQLKMQSCHSNSQPLAKREEKIMDVSPKTDTHQISQREITPPVKSTKQRSSTKKTYLLQARTLINHGAKKVYRDIFATTGILDGETIRYNLGVKSQDSVSYGITVLKKMRNGKFRNTHINFLADENGRVNVPKVMVHDEGLALRLFAGTKDPAGGVKYLESVALKLSEDFEKMVDKKTASLDSSYKNLLNQQTAISNRSLDSIVNDFDSGLEQFGRDYATNRNQGLNQRKSLLCAADENDAASIQKYNVNEVVSAYIDSCINGKIENPITIANRFNRNYATDAYLMKLKEAYLDSSRTLSEIAQDMSCQYGIKISSSTVSKYGRELTDSNSRREAIKDYKLCA